jgi:uncharacterized protein with HEPN domain
MVSVPSKHPRRRFQHILDDIEAIRTYTKGMDRASFEADRRTVDAVQRCLGRISEAARKLGDLAPGEAPGPDWAQIRGLGNRLRHDYDIVSIEVIWGIVVKHLDPLEAACRQALATLPPDQPGKRRAR